MTADHSDAGRPSDDRDRSAENDRAAKDGPPDGLTDGPRVRPGERGAVVWATAWFFFILLGYLIVRPVRETMGSIGGTKQLQGLMLVTFAVMLVAVPIYSALVARLPRRWLVRVVYHFFAACLLAFFLLMRVDNESVQVATARVFFVWVNVFSLFATSVFWSVLADLFSSSQGKRLFGMVAAGGTAGAITGSLLTSQLASVLSTSWLLLIPVVMIEIGLMCAWRLETTVAKNGVGSERGLSGGAAADDAKAGDADSDKPTGGGLLSGITHVASSPYLMMICLFLFFVQACGTQLYFEQAEIVADQIETKQQRTELFAYLDLGTQVLTLLVQWLLSGVILRRLGVAVSLVILPCVYAAGFASLAVAPVLLTLCVVVVISRAIGYGITVPAREVLFTVVSREEKYKSKSFIDTVVLRGGDAISGQIFGSLRSWGLSLSVLNLWAIPLTGLWAVVAWRLGRKQQQRSVRIPNTHRPGKKPTP
ncbi:Major Facilitator Superfamily protein [Rubripirellula lacrimiformis]|uniref:Major Facilitator Superfamily protein n=1 Tax=Rubripirellula lacrimiformis TaxID=1930273 RepID=A0A517N7M6_9BACT|nr:MFS transporter [Rubripirellula lacrimiformis]QDT03131.1 Major Facilitator Superfamily protein [Rubripirellula lacrimiformis]